MTTAVDRTKTQSEIEAQQWLHMYRRMVMIRLFEEQVNDLYTRALMPGLAHLYIHLRNQTQIWDTCAPEAILIEAGGRMTDISGNSLEYARREVRNPNGVVASNGSIHDRALRVISSQLST